MLSPSPRLLTVIALGLWMLSSVLGFTKWSRVGPVRIPCRRASKFQFRAFSGGDKYLNSGRSEPHSRVEEALLSSVNKYHLQDKGFLACVSGGSDSMAMMHAFVRLKQSGLLTQPVAVVNFNHKLREEADEEETFVRSEAEKAGIPFYSRELPLQLRTNTGLQEKARTWRRSEAHALVQALQEQSPGNQQYVVCTAHTSDDQVETVLMKLIRGVYIANIHGMQEYEDGFFRPMLNLRKSELVEYLTCLGLTWREDASNLSRKYQRNRVRLDLVPLIESLTGGPGALATRLGNLIQQSADVKTWLDAEVPQYVAKLTYISPQDPTAPHSVDLTTAAAQAMPRIVLSQLLHLWVQRVTAVALNTDRIQELTGFVLRPLAHGRTQKAFTVNLQWELVHVRSGLYLLRREHLHSWVPPSKTRGRKKGVARKGEQSGTQTNTDRPT